jgi:DNA-binding NtrC family response regulator
MSQPPGQLRVFVVDDEFVIASTLELILRNQGFDAISFCAPLDALEAACLQSPNLLISDVVMPELSGIELAIRIKEQCPNCKVLLFSGQAATAGMLEDARANGHNFAVLAKPVHPTDLLRKIREATGDADSSPSFPAVVPVNLVAQPVGDTDVE